jgi:hypothetical protein
MQTTLKNQTEVMDHRLVTYMARLAGRNPHRFCAPTGSQLRYAAWSNDDAAIRERLEYLASIGRITPATCTTGVRKEYGFIVLPRKLWEMERRKSQRAGSFRWTPADGQFLRACGIAWE